MASGIEDIVEILGEIKVNEANNSDILRNAFEEFRKSVEEKHSFAMNKLQDMEVSFNDIARKQKNLSKTSEIKDLSDILQQNINIISDDIKEQKSGIENLEKNILEICAQKPDKKDFDESIEFLKDSLYAVLSKITASDEFAKSSVENFYDKLNELVTKDDNIELTAAVRELIQKTDNTIDTLRFFNNKSENLANAIQNLIMSDDYIQSHESINKIFERTKDISTMLPMMPLKADVESISAKVNEVSNTYVQKINEINSDLQNCISTLDKSLKDEKNGVKESLMEEIAGIKSAMTLSTNSFTDKIEEFKAKVSENLSLISEAQEKHTKKTEHSLSELLDIKNEIVDISAAIQQINITPDKSNEELTENIEENLKNLSDEIDGMKNNIEFCLKIPDIQTNLDTVLYRFSEITNAIAEIKVASGSNDKNSAGAIDRKLAKIKDTLHELVHGFSEKLEIKNDKIIDDILSLKKDLKEISDNTKTANPDIEEKLDAITNSLNDNIVQITSELTSVKNIAENTAQAVELKSGFDIISSHFEDIITCINNLNTNSNKANEDFLNDVEEKLSSLKQEINLVNTDLIENFSKNNEEIEKSILGLKNDLGVLLSSDFSKDIEDLKSQIELSFMNISSDISTSFEKNNEITSNIEQITQEFQTKINNLDDYIKNEIKNELELLKFSIDGFGKNLEIHLVKNSDFIDNWEEQLEKIKSFTEHVQTSLDGKLNNCCEDLKSYIAENDSSEKIIKTINLLKNFINENFNSILNSENSGKNKGYFGNTINDICEKSIEKVNEAIESIKDFTGSNNQTILEQLLSVKNELEFCISETQSPINDLTDNIFDIKETVHKVDDDFLTVQNGLEGVAEKIENLAKSNSHLAQTLEALHSKVDILAMDDEDDDFDLESEIEDIRNLITNQLNEQKTDNYQKEMDDCFNKLLEEMNSIKDDVPNKEVKESIISAIVSIFDQISFLEESEDIKDFVEEKTDAINEKLQEVHAQLQQITSVDSSEYSYTLQDVESDIAKLRLAMNEVTNSAPQETLQELKDKLEKIISSVETVQSSLSEDEISDLKTDFVKLSEDMVSISSRTNKLLLTSDEAYKAISDGLDKFGGMIYKLEEKIHFPETKEINERIEKKIDELNTAVNISAANDKIFHQVFQYLGEWMDSVSESINSISEKTNTVSSIKEITEELKFAIPQKAELIEELEHRFENQELRIDRLEMKLDNILLAVEEKSDSIISKKLDKLEKQIAKLGINVEKLASYVDEE